MSQDHATAHNRRKTKVPRIVKFTEAENETVAIGVVEAYGFTGIEFHSCCPGWSAMVQSRLMATSASRVEGIFLPHPPE